jgi:hypothetical protein
MAYPAKRKRSLKPTSNQCFKPERRPVHPDNYRESSPRDERKNTGFFIRVARKARHFKQYAKFCLEHRIALYFRGKLRLKTGLLFSNADRKISILSEVGWRSFGQSFWHFF